MINNEETLKSIEAIYKMVHENESMHRNIIKKKLLFRGKLSAKHKFSGILDSLLDSGGLVMEKENVSINPEIVGLGVLQKKRQGAYIVTPHSRKHYQISRSVASGYKNGDLLDVVIVQVGDKKEAIVLGKSQKELEVSQEIKEKPIEKEFVKDYKNEDLILGRVVKVSHNQLVFIPNNKKCECRRIPILNRKEDYSSFQDKICLMSLVNKDAPLLGGYVAKVKGDAGNPIHEYDAIAENHGAIMTWSDPLVQQEINNIPKSVDVSKLNLINEREAMNNHYDGIVDLRHLPFVTVDPATCKDMDDAIYSTFDDNGNIVCYTAVANVTKYVNISSEIGKRYVTGGFTIYSPNKAYNILPTELSTGICSLNPNEDRLAFVVKSTIDRTTGNVLESQIYDSIIQSKKKYSYEEAQQIVDEQKENCSQGYLMGKTYRNQELTLDEQVLMNYYAAKAIKTGFERRKMIRFGGNKEREIVFDDDMKNVVDIVPIPELEYHEVIEDFMITANEATAKYAKDHKLPNVYRVHNEPKSTKVKRANEFFDILGINFNKDLSAEGTRELIAMIKNTENEEVINKFLIKMQSRAVYDTKLYTNSKPQTDGEAQISHFALQSPHYSHTTSPIRRVPDYFTQYNILAHKHGKKPINEKKIQMVVEIANARQLEVERAEKEFDDVSSVIYCEQHIGEVMHGSVSKIRYATPEEGYDDDIVVIVKNDEKGISAEIPLSQIIGKHLKDCEISRQGCAVYDKNGKIILKLCKPLDFIIEKADRKTMTIVGKTNRELAHPSYKKHKKNKITEDIKIEDITEIESIHEKV